MQPIVIPCPHCGSKLKLRNPALLGKIGKCPQCETRFPLTDPAAVTLELAEPEPPSASPPTAATESPPDFPIDVADAHSPTAQLRARRRRDARRFWIIGGTLICLALAGGGWWFAVRQPTAPPSTAEKRTSPQLPAEQRDGSALPENSAKATAKSLPEIVPGPAIGLQYVPHGVRLLINVRPAEIWSADVSGTRILDCLGQDFSAWLAARIEQHCLFSPSEIEEVKFCFYFAAPGEPVACAGVVTLAAPRKRSELIPLFSGQRRTDLELPYYVGETTAHLLIDDRKFAFCPSEMAADWKETSKSPALTRENLLRIVGLSDRDDALTIICEPTDLRLHSEFLVPSDVLQLVDPVLNWLGDDAETLLWGVRLQPSLRSRAVLMSRTRFDQDRLQRSVTERFKQLPPTMLETVSTWNPATLGTKRILGRLPAMCLAVERATEIRSEGGHTVLETQLPEIAGPNLVLATRLAWRESLRGAAPPTVATTDAEPSPATIAQRLAQRIDCDFRRTPLQEAIAYVGTETGVEFELSGDDLKLIGVTQNLPQEFAMENTPAIAILDRMLTKEGMVVVIHEAENRATMTSAKAAQERGETPLPLTRGGE